MSYLEHMQIKRGKLQEGCNKAKHSLAVEPVSGILRTNFPSPGSSVINSWRKLALAYKRIPVGGGDRIVI